ncbi:amidase [Aeromicrobium sp. 50.2.37]|uniref:amidase n=1 Tax=Aeromicrobium sp. 50.2.37 TaxID=2969305 RepID=UPI00214FCF4F|nr:amidase [Aeromicrobium sp. 50.2.37]MCR4514059.1 amidase [Aeromicrobium sp. 50.2.37]
MSDDLRALVDDPALRRSTSAREMVAASLEAIEAAQPTLNAFIAVDAEQALADADAVDALPPSQRAGLPLAGWPIAVKDNIDVSGYVSTAGSSLFASDAPATRDSDVVQRLRAAGAVVVGKVTLHELAYGGTNDNATFGPCRNPWDVDRVPGGSSGGSGAAAGADLCLAALGTDTGGSVRIPASYNGVTGLRPTFGSASNVGVRHISASFDTVGVLARSALDVAQVQQVIAGPSPHDPWSLPAGHPWLPSTEPEQDAVAGLRVGVLDDFFTADVDEEVLAGVAHVVEVLRDLGADVEACTVPGASRANDLCGRIIRAEAYAAYADDLVAHRHLLGADVVARLELGARLTGAEVSTAYTEARAWSVTARDLVRRYDVLVGPTVSSCPPRIDEVEDMVETTARGTRLTYPWSLAGLPALSMPCGVDSRGLPLGAQVVGAPGRDGLLLGVAAAFQTATDHHRRRPSGVGATA